MGGAKYENGHGQFDDTDSDMGNAQIREVSSSSLPLAEANTIANRILLAVALIALMFFIYVCFMPVTVQTEAGVKVGGIARAAIPPTSAIQYETQIKILMEQVKQYRSRIAHLEGLLRIHAPHVQYPADAEIIPR